MKTRRVTPGIAIPPGRESDTGEAGRFLERSGLLTDVSRDASRDGTPNADERERRLRFIGIARSLGYELHEVRDLMALLTEAHRGTSRHAVRLAQQVDVAEQKIVALMRVRQVLLEMLDDATAERAALARTATTVWDELLQRIDEPR